MGDNQYRREGFCVDPLSEADIRAAAEKLRAVLYDGGHKYVDVIDLIERKMPILFENFRYEIVGNDELPDREAEFNPYEYCLRVREEVYEKAFAHDGHCRFTLAHELGHFFLHRNQTLAFARYSENGEIPPFRNSEWQADMFARHLLVPLGLARGMSVAAIAAVFEVSLEVAKIVREKVDEQFAVVAVSPQRVRQGFLPGLNWNWL
jgi:Zn-dependent peptidase ImmA (M78 family)